MKSNYHFYYTDSTGKKWTIHFHSEEFLNLMFLVLDKGYEDWGNCKGKAKCGTCHCIAEDNILEESLDTLEKQTLNRLHNKRENSRLSCRITVTKSLHNRHFLFLGKK